MEMPDQFNTLTRLAHRVSKRKSDSSPDVCIASYCKFGQTS